MRSIWFAICIVAVLAISTAAVNAQLVDITRPGDTIEVVSGTNYEDADDGPPPGAEGVENVINDVGQKYLNFLDLGSGFAVTPSANPSNLPVVGIRFYTANDAVSRDPSSYVLSGSNTGLNGTWTVIAGGLLALPDERNAGGEAVSIPPEGNLGAFNQTVMFDNSSSYESYRVIFPTLKDELDANSMQIADVELLVAIPEPAGICLALIAIGCLLVRRRR